MSLRAPSPEAFLEFLQEHKIEAVSFDVFDTLVTRTYAQPTDLFHDLGIDLQRAGLTEVIPERFARLRVTSERMARNRRVDTEPNLVEIYDELAERLRWSAEQALAAREAELAREKTSCRGNPETAALLQAVRARGLPVAFVSDMYLPASCLRQMLEAQGLAIPGDLILVSNEHRCSKAGGGLFEVLLEKWQRPASSILHIGDNLLADEQQAGRKGLKILRVHNTHLGFLESLHLPFSPDTGGLAGRIAAASRHARLCSPREVANEALYEIGSGFLGPLLASFALWTFQGAKRRGLRRLYYIARDGQVMREVALAVQRRLPEFQDIECRYIYGSRIAWHHSSLAALDERHLRWLLEPQPIINAEILACRLGAPPERIKAILTEAGAGALASAERWTDADLHQVRPILIAGQDTVLAAAGAEERRNLGKSYFQQEGLLDDVPWGLVELGWSGSMLTSLCHALERKTTLPAFYLCQSAEDPDLPGYVELRSFLMQPKGAQLHLARGLRLSELIEALAAADHPTTLGYQREGSRIGPILKSGTIPMWPTPQLRSLRAGASGFVEALDTDTLASLQTWTADEHATRLLAWELLSVISRFAEAPTRDLAEPFTECVFSEDPAEQHRRTFVAKVGLWKALKERVFTSDDLWPQGSLAVSNGLITALVTGGFGFAFEHFFRQVRQRLRF